ncbi:hypothetical protein D3C87_241510 [compost metagenome]
MLVVAVRGVRLPPLALHLVPLDTFGPGGRERGRKPEADFLVFLFGKGNILKILFVVFSLFSSVAFAKFESYSSYSSLTCYLKTEAGEPLMTFNESFIPVKMDDHMGMFKQMRAQVGLDQIQLQVLLEDDSVYNAPGYVNFLVHLAVNGKEVSSEFSGKEINHLRIRHLQYQAACDLN